MERGLHDSTQLASTRALVVGFGYVGKRLAQRVGTRWSVRGIVRSEASAARTPEFPIAPLDLDHSGLPPGWIDAVNGAALIYLAPPPPVGVSDSRLQRFLDSTGPAAPGMVLYMSTTGVYGDCGGETVNEQSSVRPGSDAARRRVAAEQIATRFCDQRSCRCVVFRVPGIYGPQRLPTERLLRGEPAIRPAEAPPGNRIHVDDLVSACIAAVEQPVHGIFNIGDGNHASSTAFMQTTARLAGLPEPRLISMAEAGGQLSPGMMSFLRESRRVETRRMREELDFQLRYEDFGEGIAASLSQAPPGSDG